MRRLGSMPLSTAKGPLHGAAEMHTGESLGVPLCAGTAEGGWDQSRYLSSCTSPFKPA